jgi:predicted esterase
MVSYSASRIKARDFSAIRRSSSLIKELYWQDDSVKPITQVPPAAKPPYPLLIAIHGNGFNAMHSASQWVCAAEAGWLVFHPLARRLVGLGAHWWVSHEESRAIIEQQVEENLLQYPIDSTRVIMGGFSKGGEVLSREGAWGEGLYHGRAGGYYHTA